MPNDTSNVILRSRDGGEAVVRRDIAVGASLLLRDLLDGEPSSSDVVVPTNIGSRQTLNVVADYMIRRFKQPPREIPRPLVGPFSANVDAIDYDLSVSWTMALATDVLRAANYLNYAPLRALACARIAAFIAHMNVEEVRALLGVKADFTSEEEQDLRQRHGLPL